LDIELIINTADLGELGALRAAVAELRARSQGVQARVTFEPGDATRFAREAAARGADLVLAAGGDGTVNEVVNGLIDPGPDSVIDPGAGPRLGIVPLGTGNDLAGFLGVPNDVMDAVQLAIDGPELLVDVGLLNGRRFINVSSGGIGAEATDETSDRSKRLLGSFAYLVSGARKLPALEPSSARFVSGGETVFEGDFLIFAVGNGGRAGGGNWITPRADMTDGLLDLCVIGDIGHAALLKLLPELRSGDHLDAEGVVYFQLPELAIEPFGEMTVNVDGELIDAEVLNYSLIPRALRLGVGAGEP
jgi:diacylglycerol kinase (ATP)